jgi:hypothetical protein
MPQRRLRLAQEQVSHRFVLEKNQKKSLTGAKNQIGYSQDETERRKQRRS